MGFVESLKSYFKGFVAFSGETEKQEYIWHLVVCFLTAWITCGIAAIGLWASSCRRMETLGYNKWLGLLVAVIPFFWVVVLFLNEKK